VKTLLPVLVVFTIMASVLFLVSQIEVPQLEKHFVHEGVWSWVKSIGFMRTDYPADFA